MYCSNGLKRRWIWQEMKQIRLAFCFAGWRLAALFPFDWSIKSALPLSKPGPITESNFESQAVCPALCAARNSLSTLPKSGRGRRRVGNISSRFLLRDPLIVASCPLTLWPPLTSGHHVTSRANWSLSQPGERGGQKKQKQRKSSKSVLNLKPFTTEPQTVCTPPRWGSARPEMGGSWLFPGWRWD